jgi:hypothetical protein
MTEAKRGFLSIRLLTGRKQAMVFAISTPFLRFICQKLACYQALQELSWGNSAMSRSRFSLAKIGVSCNPT